MKITIEQLPENIKTTEQFVKRMFYLLWKAASVAGMGFLQDRGEQPEDVVWERCKQGHDSGTIGKSINRLCADYQSWCRTYPTAESIKQAVFDSFN